MIYIDPISRQRVTYDKYSGDIEFDVKGGSAISTQVIPKIKNTKVAYLSVVRMSDAEKEALLKEKNLVGFIQKPFDIKDLLKKVKGYIGS